MLVYGGGNYWMDFTKIHFMVIYCFRRFFKAPQASSQPPFFELLA